MPVPLDTFLKWCVVVWVKGKRRWTKEGPVGEHLGVGETFGGSCFYGKICLLVFVFLRWFFTDSTMGCMVNSHEKTSFGWKMFVIFSNNLRSKSNFGKPLLVNLIGYHCTPLFFLDFSGWFTPWLFGGPTCWRRHRKSILGFAEVIRFVMRWSDCFCRGH